MYGEIAAGFFFLALSGAFFLESRGFPPGPRGSYLNSSVFPGTIAVLMALCSLILIARAFKPAASGDGTRDKPINRRGLAAIALAVLYIVLFPYLGFPVSSFLLLVSYAWLLQPLRKKWMDTILFPLIIVNVIYLLFRVLNVYLPPGELFAMISN